MARGALLGVLAGLAGVFADNTEVVAFQEGEPVELGWCGGEPSRTSCRVCQSDGTNVFDLSSLLGTVMSLSYDIGVGLKVWEVNPCGLGGLSWTNPDATYIETACHNRQPDEDNVACYCHPESSKNCAVIATTKGSRVYAGVTKIDNMSVMNNQVLVVRYGDRTQCNDKCSACSLTLLFRCSETMAMGEYELTDSTMGMTHLCSHPDDSGFCHPCLTVETRAMCQYQPCPNNCSNHGTCVTESGHCQCRPQWGGSDCSQNLECMRAGACSNFSTCAWDQGDAICTCRSGWKGDGKVCSPAPGHLGDDPSLSKSWLIAITVISFVVCVALIALVRFARRDSACCPTVGGGARYARAALDDPDADPSAPRRVRTVELASAAAATKAHRVASPPKKKPTAAVPV